MKRNKYIFFLILIALISHLQWFNPFSILNSSDWNYWPNEVVVQLYYSYGTWINFFNFGIVNIQLTFNLFTSIWSIFANLGFSYDFATKITFLIPIAILGFVSPYILFRKLTNSDLISFTSALIYGTTTHFLMRQIAHMPVAFVYALTPLIFYFFIKALERNKFIDWLFFVLIYWISGCYEIRITYIVTVILFLYFVYFQFFNIKKYWKNITKSILLFIGLNVFWLFPTLLGGFSENISVVANRGLFGNFLFDLKHALTLTESAWTGSLIVPFVNQPISLYFWLIPFIAFFVFLSSNLIYRKNIIFFGVISLVGVFLTKQGAEPFANAYFWLYSNFPGFNLFREASKFYLITAFGYAGLLGYSLLAVKDHKNKIFNKYLFYTYLIILIIISLWNLKPLVTGEIRTMFIPRHIPNDYIVFKDFILNQPESFRTFWTPSNSRWGIYTKQKPKISNVTVIESEWKNLISPYNKNEKLMQNQIINIFKFSFADNLFNSSSIKYVIIPLQDIANDDDFFIHYGGKDNPNIRNWYISELDKVTWLKKIDIGTSELVVYENANYKPHIYSDIGLNYSQTNASEFGDFSQNQNLYLNSKINKNNYLFNELDNIIIPIEPNPDYLSTQQLVVDKTIDPAEKKKLQSELDLYATKTFIKDYRLSIPSPATYKIYFKKDSILANNLNTSFKINDRIIKKDELGKETEGWNYFSQVELDKGEYDLKLYIGETLINTINSGDIVLAAENLVDPIKTPQLEYRQINPTKYIVNVTKASESFPLIFSESFHPAWKIYVAPDLAGQGTGQFISENNQGTVQNDNLNGMHFYDLMFRKPVLDDKHLLINGFANAWWIDINELAKQGKITKNADGTYNFSVYIEFEPQKYFYIGLWISGITLIGCLTYLVYDFIKRRKKEKMSS